MLKSMKGIEGTITIPALGALIGTTHKWSLERREDGKQGEAPTFRLHAVFSYFNEFLWSEETLKKEIILTLRSAGGQVNSQLKVEPVPGEGMVLDGTTQLILEGVRLWPVDKE